ncbi:MAG: hypothetical protein ACOX6L_10625 [Syntrophomonadaceae bacterium]|jgi:hypothetical protein
MDVASVPLSIANEKILNTCRAQEVSYEELPQISFDEFSDDYAMPMPFEDEYSAGTVLAGGLSIRVLKSLVIFEFGYIHLDYTSHNMFIYV